MRNPMGSPWWRDSNQNASGKPGAVHDDTTLCLLIHDADGIEAQQLRLRRLSEHPEYLAPERERYGELCCSELGLTGLSERLAGSVENSNSELESPRAERSRLPIKILTDQASPGSKEILRRNNATWFEVICPEIPSVSSLLLERDISLPEGVTDADAAFLVTPLEGSLREALISLLRNYLPKLQLISSTTIAIGALKAGHRLERGIPHYLDRLDPIALAVMRQDGPVFEELIPQSATVPANKEYVSDPIRGIVWVAQKDQVEFYIRKGSREIRAWKTERVTAPYEDQPVEIQLSQQPAQGWARVVVTSPNWDTLKRAPIRLNWSDLVPDYRTEAEILATLERPKPGIPDRVVYSANYDLWDGTERYPGVKRALQKFDSDDAEAVDLLSEQIKAPFRPIGSPETYYPISTDGDLPAKASPDDSRLLDRIIAEVSQRLMEHTTGQRGRLRDNDLLQCATWVFTRCPDEIQNLMIDAIEAVAGNRNHRLLAPRSAKRVVLHGLGRCISDQARIRKVLGIIVALDQNADTRAAVASILSRRDEAPNALDDVLVDRIGKQTDRALKNQLRINSYQRDFKYTIFVLAGLLRYREAEPYAMLAERSDLARSILRTLEEIGRQLKRQRTAINSAAEKMLLVDELKSFLSGQGGDPNILRMIEDLRG